MFVAETQYEYRFYFRYLVLTFVYYRLFCDKLPSVFLMVVT